MVASQSSRKTAATVPLLVLLQPTWSGGKRCERYIARRSKPANQNFCARSLT